LAQLSNKIKKFDKTIDTMVESQSFSRPLVVVEGWADETTQFGGRIAGVF
jgi:hypothetical protein